MLPSWLHHGSCRFQEVVPLSAGNVLGAENNAPAARWQQLIQQTLNNMGTCTYCSDRLLQMNGGHKCSFDERTNPCCYMSNNNPRASSSHGPNSKPRLCSTSAKQLEAAESIDSMDMEDSSVTSFNQDDQSQSTTGGNNSSSVSKACSSTMGLSTSRPCAVPISRAGLNSNQDQMISRGSSTEMVSRSHYTMIASKQMVGLYVSVWVKSCLCQSVRDVKVSCIGCGLMGYLGNKVCSTTNHSPHSNN